MFFVLTSAFGWQSLKLVGMDDSNFHADTFGQCETAALQGGIKHSEQFPSPGKAWHVSAAKRREQAGVSHARVEKLKMKKALLLATEIGMMVCTV